MYPVTLYYEAICIQWIQEALSRKCFTWQNIIIFRRHELTLHIDTWGDASLIALVKYTLFKLPLPKIGFGISNWSK